MWAEYCKLVAVACLARSCYEAAQERDTGAPALYRQTVGDGSGAPPNMKALEGPTEFGGQAAHTDEATAERRLAEIKRRELRNFRASQDRKWANWAAALRR